MNNFRTEIITQPHNKQIEYDSSVLFIGSCFANNIGSKCEEAKIPCMINPYGTIYNPISVKNTLKFIIDKYQFSEKDLRYENNLWHTFSHHSSFNDSDKEQYLKQVNKNNEDAHQFLKEADFLFITFGTAWVYQFIENNQVVSNCHKYPNKSFNRYILNISEIIDIYKTIITELLVFNPTLNIVFTVSPVRHWKDGAHGNQISKATLLLAIEQLVDTFESCSYFPAYEFIIDDLRDYRFYDKDMIHPNDVAVDYIWEKFESHFLSQAALVYQNEFQKLSKSLNHRPFNINSPQHQDFLRKLLQKLNQLKIKYPNVNISKELSKLKSEIL
ncbi:GSCFA domain-containing protein [Saccharicrinis aurantiacus]|uniref:GSCFA domain-containing protein n=1 Tax=Saccharicrinis aurantiacus TaxID=1849719 RepID=UPI0024931FE6|nr:GSCFA domain-containing protein [Saccharicrinis aurantiacus]